MKPKFNRGNNGHANRVRNIIYSVAQLNGTWDDITIQVSEYFDVKNWLHVRGILQVMKDERIIARDANLYVERFHLVTK